MAGVTSNAGGRKPEDRGATLGRYAMWPGKRSGCFTSRATPAPRPPGPARDPTPSVLHLLSQSAAWPTVDPVGDAKSAAFRPSGIAHVELLIEGVTGPTLVMPPREPACCVVVHQVRQTPV